MALAVLLLLASTSARATPLGDLVASMAPATWAELKPSNPAVIQALPMITAYANGAAWDSTRRQMRFCGSYASSGDKNVRCIVYDDATNSFSTFAPPFVAQSHAYDVDAIDVAQGFLYFRQTVTYNVYRYAIASDTWTQLPPPPWNIPRCCAAMVHFPEYNGGGVLILNNTYNLIYFMADGSNQWVAVPNSNNLWTTGESTWHIMEYDPVHHWVIISDSTRIWRMTSDGKIVRLNDAKASIYNGTQGQFSTDPVTGTHLILTPTSRQFYLYDSVAQSWSLGVQPPPLNGLSMAQTPVDTYGVTMFFVCGTVVSRCDGRLLVYKHSGAAPPPDGEPPSAPSNLTVSSVGVNLSWSASTDNVGVTGYKVERCQGVACGDFVQIGAPQNASLSDGGLTPSAAYAYRVRGVDAAGNLSAYSSVLRLTTSAQQ